MFQSAWQDFKYQMQTGNSISKLIIVNVLLFVLINFVNFILFIAQPDGEGELYRQILHILSLPSQPEKIVFQPWSLLSHMFLHERFFHILFNMLYLYWFGRIYGDLIGDKQVVPTYIFSGLVGALFFIASSYLLFDGQLQYALGASAAVMGITIAAAMIAPEYTLNLLLIGPVKLKYLAIVLVLLDIFLIPSMNNVGGHFGHLGGAFGGFLFVQLLYKGFDLSRMFKSDKKKKQSKMAKVFEMKPKHAVHGRKENENEISQEQFENRLNAILDKIKKKGQQSLTEDEISFLEKASKRT